MQVDIQQASVEDADEILALQKLAYRSEAELYGDWSIAPLTQTLDQLRRQFSDHIILKACADGRIVGSARGVLRDGVCQVGRVIVHPDVQRRGIGSALLRAIEKAFPQAETFELFTCHLSEGNIRLYRRLGYEVGRTQQVSDSLTLVFLNKAGNP